MSYEENGYLYKKNLFTSVELQELHLILISFHESWKKDHADFFAKKAVNSSDITCSKYLNQLNRQKLFEFISSDPIAKMLSQLIPERPMFMNTQLFFNPVNFNQKNYWHRDHQYHLSIDEQKKTLAGPRVLHFRIPLMNEPGIELIPGSHERWDSKEEFEIRMEENGKKNSDELSSGKKIQLEAGDLLVFSANMIHRGLYGMNRFALDILFCDFDPNLTKFINKDCLPTVDQLENLENSYLFKNTNLY